MNVRVRALACSLALSLVVPWFCAVLPRPALAQDDATTAEARKRFLEGVKLFDEKKYELARASFLQAYALKKHPDVLLNLAQAELLGGRHMESAQHFKEFLKDTANEKHPKRGEAVKGLDEARAKLGRIQITVDASDADVFLDGNKIGTSPLAEAIDVAPGQHAVEAKRSGKSTAQNVDAPAGKTIIVNLTIEPPVVPVTPPPPAATSAAPAPTAPPPAPPAPPPSEKVSLSTEEPSSGRREPFMQWARRSPVAYTGAGLAAVGLGFGIGFGIASQIAQSNADTLTSTIKSTAANDGGLANYPSPTPDNPNGTVDRRSNPCATPIAIGLAGNYGKACTNLRNNLDAADTNRTLMTVGFIAAGVGAVTIVGGYFLTAKRSDTGSIPAPRLMVAPVLGPQLAGLGAAGSF
ncbi:MAG: DUF2846 domain-containing protein [Polyangiaceae bacterium]|jgi:hypothetical protein|nr:DUF2846 domain-containing protein [Polyangiaceae bacterium]